MKIQDAVSVVLIYQDKILLVKRQNHLKAFPGYWAYPGGKIDKLDLNQLHNPATHIRFDVINAMLRELKEELGLDLTDVIKLNPKCVNLLGIATTPDFNPIRFATYFIAIHLSKLPQIEIDSNELSLAVWNSPDYFIEQYNLGKLLIVPPVLKVIHSLAKNINTKIIDSLNFEYDEKSCVPMIEPLNGFKQFMPLSHTLPPATRTNSFLIGTEQDDTILVDPSPKEGEECERFLNSIKNFKINKILLTHQHPDHFECSNFIAQKLDVDIYISQDSYQRIKSRLPDFFKDNRVHFLSDQMDVGTWLGEKIKVMSVPGHDEGQMAPFVESKSWFIAGDLFQGMGSVVVGGDEGDMRKYMDTLSKVISYGPEIIFPSHGIGLGGVNVLENILKHRHEREEQIIKLYEQNKTEDEMLSILYAGLDPKLEIYARENIRKHLKSATHRDSKR